MQSVSYCSSIFDGCYIVRSDNVCSMGYAHCSRSSSCIVSVCCICATCISYQTSNKRHCFSSNAPYHTQQRCISGNIMQCACLQYACLGYSLKAQDKCTASVEVRTAAQVAQQGHA